MNFIIFLKIFKLKLKLIRRLETSTYWVSVPGWKRLNGSHYVPVRTSASASDHHSGEPLADN